MKFLKSTAAFYLTVALLTMTTSAQPNSELTKLIQPLVDAHKGTVAVSIKHLPTGQTFKYQAEKPLPTASLIKLPVLVAMHQAIADGKIALDDEIELQEADKVPGSGVLTGNFSAGTKITLRDAARLMIVFSDNTATNLVVDRIGLPATAELMEKSGYPNTKMHAKVFKRETSIFPERSKRFGLGSTTANEMVRLLEQIAKKEILNPSACDQIVDLLLACDDRSKIPRNLPAEVKVAHKTGAVSNARTDAGLIDAPTGKIAICILTNDNADRGWSDDNEANVLCGQIAEAAFDFFNPDGVPTEDSNRLAVGSDGELVEALQRTLNARLDPSPDLGIDGDFGPATEAAVKAFQRSVELPEDGIVTEAMWRKLGNLLTEPDPVADPQVINSESPAKRAPLLLNGPPFVTCKAWAMADGATGKILWSSNESERLHPASTTKIMTGYAVLKLAESDSSILDETVTFTSNADKTIGSTSGVKAGEQVSVGELLYGLLLPSGNDASVALAEHFGGRIVGGEAQPNAKGNFSDFVAGMNELAKQLGMSHTNFTNTHGLTNEEHLTSAADLSKLAHVAMQMPEFRKRTNTEKRGCTLTSESGYQRNVLWKNTNRLLRFEGFEGVKTGTTSAAGACLVSRCELDGRVLQLVVLGADTSNARYVDSKNLYRWAWQQLNR